MSQLDWPAFCVAGQSLFALRVDLVEHADRAAIEISIGCCIIEAEDTSLAG